MKRRILFILLVTVIWIPVTCISTLLILPYWIFTGKIIYDSKEIEYIENLIFKLIE